MLPSMMNKNHKDVDKDVEQKDEKPVIKSQIEKIRDFIMEKYNFRYNVLTQTLEYRDLNGIGYEQLTDQVKTDIVISLKQMMFKKPKEDLDDILNSSMIPRFDPIKDYFRDVEYKGDGYIKRLCRLITLEDPERIIGGKRYCDLFLSYMERWLMACYLCSTGLKANDMMLILIGRRQGQFKTTFLEHLIPKSLSDYSVTQDINPSLADYNTANYLAEKMFINVDDLMEKIIGKDYNSMKSIISITDVTSRKLYKSSHQRRRRIANFVGSVNEPRFLRDSNNRRYLCFQIDEIDQRYKDFDMDAMWAEVKHKADKLQSIFIFTREDYEMIDKMNASFEAPTEESEALSTLLMPADPEIDKDIYFMQFTEILRVLREYTRNNSLKSYNLQTAMRKFGYETRSVKMSRFSMQPRYLYAVKLVQQTAYCCDLVQIYKKDN